MSDGVPYCCAARPEEERCVHWQGVAILAAIVVIAGIHILARLIEGEYINALHVRAAQNRAKRRAQARSKTRIAVKSAALLEEPLEEPLDIAVSDSSE